MKKLLWISFYFLLFSLALSNSFKYLDPDFGWHLQVGHDSVISQDVPRENIYNFSYTGNWVNHEWFSDVILFYVYDNLGYISLSVLFALLVTLTFALLAYYLKRIKPEISSYAIMTFQLIGFYACLPHFGIRIQEFALLFLLLILIIIDYFVRKRKAYIPFLLIPLMYLWSITHGSFLMGFAVLFAFLFYKLLESIVLKYRTIEMIDSRAALNIKEIGLFFVAIIAAWLSTLLSPYKFELYSFLSGYRDTFYLTHIQEWLPQHFFPFQYPQMIYLAIILLGYVLYVFYKLKKKEKFDLWHFIALLIFVLASFKSRRHFPLAVIATFPLVMESWRSLLDIGNSQTKDDNVKDENIFFRYLKSRKIIIHFLMFTILATSTNLLLTTKFNNNPFLSFCHSYPCQAVNYLASNSEYDDLKLFNEYGWGGYLIHQLPERKIFIDGRLPQVQYKEHTFLEEYYEFFRIDKHDQPKAGDKLEEHEINLVLLKRNDVMIKPKKWESFVFGINSDDIKVKNSLREYLEKSSEWEDVYKDDTSIIYKRKSPIY